LLTLCVHYPETSTKDLKIVTQELPLCLCLITGAVDPALVLEQIEAHIATVKDEAFIRKDILEKVERWLNACEEEAWLEYYNKVRISLILCM
jgi:hypothetical protein